MDWNLVLKNLFGFIGPSSNSFLISSGLDEEIVNRICLCRTVPQDKMQAEQTACAAHMFVMVSVVVWNSSKSTAEKFGCLDSQEMLRASITTLFISIVVRGSLTDSVSEPRGQLVAGGQRNDTPSNVFCHSHPTHGRQAGLQQQNGWETMIHQPLHLSDGHVGGDNCLQF